MKYAQVLEVYLNDDAEAGPYSIQALLKQSNSSQKILAKPLNVGDVKIPVVGEYVQVERAPSEFASTFGSGRRSYYYSNPVSIQGNVNNNILENASTLQPNNTGQDYEQVSLGVPNSSTSSPSNKKNKEFVEVSNLSQLQPYSGDSILQGRFGQSIRFGYTPKNAEADTKPNWSSTLNDQPITIIRNSSIRDGYNKFIIEDINNDDSSIWMGSKQIIGLESSNPFTLGVTPQSTYKNPQIVINSDRIVLNSKTDSVLISGNKSVNVSTPNWKADMDVIFTQLEAITDTLIQLAPALTAAAVIAPPAPPIPLVGLNTAGPQIASAAAQIKTQLTLMKQ